MTVTDALAAMAEQPPDVYDQLLEIKGLVGTGDSGIVASTAEPAPGYQVWFQIDPVTGALLDILTPDGTSA